MFVRILKILKRTDAFAHVVLALSSLMSYFMLFDFKKKTISYTQTHCTHAHLLCTYVCSVCRYSLFHVIFTSICPCKTCFEKPCTISSRELPRQITFRRHLLSVFVFQEETVAAKILYAQNLLRNYLIPSSYFVARIIGAPGKK